MRVLPIIFSCALMAFAAACQTTTPGAPAASVQNGAHLEEARRIIAAGNAGEFFAPAADDDWVMVRHRGSGLVCRFATPTTSARITIFPAGSYGASLGEDVACGQVLGDGTVITLYATRYPAPKTVDQALQDILSEMQSAHGALTPYQPTLHAELPQAPPIESRTAMFTIPRFQDQEGVHLTRVSVAVVRGWVIMMRYTAPNPPAAELTAELTWVLALRDLAQAV